MKFWGTKYFSSCSTKYSYFFRGLMFLLVLHSCDSSKKKEYTIHIRVVTGNNNRIGNTLPKELAYLMNKIYSDDKGISLLKPIVTIERYDSAELGILTLKADNLNTINFSVFTAYAEKENDEKLSQFMSKHSGDSILVFNTSSKKYVKLNNRIYKPFINYKELITGIINNTSSDNQELILLYNIYPGIEKQPTPAVINSPAVVKPPVIKVTNPTAVKKNRSNIKSPKKTSPPDGYHTGTTPGH
ncbi:MAG: hypothetical protein U0T69_10890 [Chitinophagales bacterium]